MLKILICHDSVHICCVIYDIRNNIYQTHTAKHERNNRWMWLSSFDFLGILLWNVDTGLKKYRDYFGYILFRLRCNWGLVCWSKYQWQWQVIASYIYCGIQLLVPVLDTCFCHNILQLWTWWPLSYNRPGCYRQVQIWSEICTDIPISMLMSKYLHRF